ncbi:MAG: hypothetical protein BroJett013_07050 [Alphaproteobacteria bacterium]|nr:MAG: hypothetical protein BroJett013_07050 [Alphaproteobacteria bacterium]
MPSFAATHKLGDASEKGAVPCEKSAAGQPRHDEGEGDAEAMQSHFPDSCVLAAAVLAVSDDTRITDAQFRVFSLIAKGYCRRADMAARMGKSVSTVARAIDALIKLRLIEREPVPGKPSKLRVSGLVLSATRAMSEATTRIADAARGAGDTGGRVVDEPTSQTSVMGDTTTQVTGDATAPNDTGSAVDNAGGACIGTGARAETPNLKTRASQIQSDQIEPVTKAMIAALIDRCGQAINPTAADVHHAGELNRLLRGGCLWDEDILPAADKLAASFLSRGKRFGTWRLLEEHALDLRDRRLAGVRAPEAIPLPSYRPVQRTRGGPYRANGITPLVAVG